MLTAKRDEGPVKSQSEGDWQVRYSCYSSGFYITIECDAHSLVYWICLYRSLVPRAAIRCLLSVLFVIAATIVHRFIPVYVQKKSTITRVDSCDFLVLSNILLIITINWIFERNLNLIHLFLACRFYLTQSSVYSTISAMYGAALADFNQDNRLDIVVATFATSN